MLVSSILGTPRALPSRGGRLRPRCAACGHERARGSARLEGWQISRDGRTLRCAACAAQQFVMLDDQLLHWPACGHALDDDTVLYDCEVCVSCEEAATGASRQAQSGKSGIAGP